MIVYNVTLIMEVKEYDTKDKHTQFMVLSVKALTLSSYRQERHLQRSFLDKVIHMTNKQHIHQYIWITEP